VLGAYVFMIECGCFLFSKVDHALGAWGERQLGRRRHDLRALLHELFDLEADLAQVHVHVAQDGGGHA
jgi:hypothetical protein